MDTSTIDQAAIVAALTDHGDTFELPDGRTLRLKVEHDPYTSIMDEQGEGVWCGRLEWDDSRTENAYGYRMRPDGFTGRAEVISRDRDARLWWEVPGDIVIGSDHHRTFRQTILELLEYGYKMVTVELCEECDHGGEHVVNFDTVGGCDSVYPELVADLVSEVLS